MLPEPVSDRNEPDLFAAISAIEPFRGAADAAIRRLADAGELRAYAAGEMLYAMGQYDGSEFLIVRAGLIKATHTDPETGAIVIEEAAGGDVFGLSAVISGREGLRATSMSLAAEKESVVIFVNAETIRELASCDLSIATRLMLFFARRLSGVATTQSDSSPERRVYAALLNEVERDAVSGEWKIRRMPKHRDLAQRANVDEAEAAAAVAKLIQSGVARREYPGAVIEDMSQMNKLSR